MDTVGSRVEEFEVGRVLGRAFGVVGRNLGKLLLLALICYGLQYGAASLARLYVDPLLHGSLAPAALLHAVPNRIFAGFLTGGITLLTVRDLEGRPAGAGETLAAGIRSLIPVTVLSLVLGLGIGLGALLLVVPGFMLALRWFVALQVLVIERCGFDDAVSRSAELTGGHRWRLLGLSVLIGALSMLVLALPVAFDRYGGVRILLAGGIDFNAVVLGIATGGAQALAAVGYATTYSELRRVQDGAFSSRLACVFA